MPAIVIAASGMCSGGRMQNFLQELLPDERADVIFIGYQVKGTSGRDVQSYGPRFAQENSPDYVQFDSDSRAGPKIEIRAGIYTLGGYSAYTDQKDLINFVKRMRMLFSLAKALTISRTLMPLPVPKL